MAEDDQHGKKNVPHPNIIELIMRDLQSITPKPMRNFQLIRAKDGIYVYRCTYGNIPAVVKYFEKEADRREILNYRILAQHNIPTIKTLALGKAAFVMEDISASDTWRLGAPEDFKDGDIAESLARWYFTFHESGATVADSLYFEYDSLTEENLSALAAKLPEAQDLFQFILSRYEDFRQQIYAPSFTLTYNDFYWSNFVVRKDKTAAMMFDYNLMGKGYRFSDFRNVCWPLSDEAKAAFVSTYNQLYMHKHGYSRTEAEKTEERIENLAGPLFSLHVAFTEKENFPSWAQTQKKEAVDGTLLAKAKQLLL